MACLALGDRVSTEADALLRVEQARLPEETWDAPHPAQRLLNSHGAQRFCAVRLFEGLEPLLQTGVGAASVSAARSAQRVAA